MDNILIGIRVFRVIKKLYNSLICTGLIYLGIAFIQDWSIASIFDDHIRQMLLGALLIKWGVSK